MDLAGLVVATSTILGPREGTTGKDANYRSFSLNEPLLSSSLSLPGIGHKLDGKLGNWEFVNLGISHPTHP